MDNFPTAQERTKKKDRIKKLGRPPSYSTAEELQNKIEKYFNGGAMKRYVVTDSGATIGVPCPTISDLVLFLGFCDRRSFYAYEALPDFSYTIKKARTMIEREYEMLLRTSSCGGAIFALKNFGWTDQPSPQEDGDLKDTKLRFSTVPDNGEIQERYGRFIN